MAWGVCSGIGVPKGTSESMYAEVGIVLSQNEVQEWENSLIYIVLYCTGWSHGTVVCGHDYLIQNRHM